MIAKRLPLMLLLALAGMVLGACQVGQGRPSNPHSRSAGPKWTLVWSDEFDGKGMPDRKKWNYEEGFIRNDEMQYYTRERRENARLEQGVLVIEGRKERMANPHYDPRSKSWQRNRKFAQYTAASLNTRNIAAWQYGRIEVRAMLPEGKGMWPAIWTLGLDGHWPANGEIDIMEWWGRNPDYVFGTTHYALGGKHRSSQGKTPIKNPGKGFHVYAVEWYPDRLDFYFDRTKYYSFPIRQADDSATNPYRKPHYLLINLALGGKAGGAIDDSRLPQQFLIDYVRVYQQKKR